MDEKEERLHKSAANAKLLSLNESVLFPLLNKKVEQNIATLCEDFKQGKPVDLNAIAYLAVARDMVQELDSLARHGLRDAEKLGLTKPQ